MAAIAHIFVPTKGRAKVAKLPDVLLADNLTPTLVVEPQEVEDYYLEYGSACKYLELKENNRGIGYSRNQILQYCRSHNINQYWQIDDDILGFGIKGIDGKISKSTPSSVLLELQEIGRKYEFSLLSPAYSINAWHETLDLKINGGYCINCILTNTLTGINYDEDLRTGEDTDFQIKSILAGYPSVLVNSLVIYVSSGGFSDRKKIGGCSDEYRNGTSDVMIDRLLSRYPGILMSSSRGKDLGKLFTVRWKVLRGYVK